MSFSRKDLALQKKLSLELLSLQMMILTTILSSVILTTSFSSGSAPTQKCFWSEICMIIQTTKGYHQLSSPVVLCRVVSINTSSVYTYSVGGGDFLWITVYKDVAPPEF
mmetsp:Transcript_21472/g.36783  ORF Transcript_21472/g.36783 Transcript_21472/m.36783 type:complete len:109 (-) Transcript_21472:88-414(-)